MPRRSLWSALRGRRDGEDLFTVPAQDATAEPSPPIDQELVTAIEQVAACRERNLAKPSNRAELIDALSNLTIPLFAAGRVDEVIDSYLEILRLGAGLVDSDRFVGFGRGDLELFVDLLLGDLVESGRWDRAGDVVEAIEEAVAAYRRGAEEQRQGYRWWLAGTLSRLSTVLSRLGRGEEAVAAAEEAASLARDELADVVEAVDDGTTDEYAHTPIELAYSGCRRTLAESIIELADRLDELDRHDEAIGVTADAVRDLRLPPTQAADAEYATILFAHAQRLGHAEREADAMRVRLEGIDILRRLADVDDEPDQRLVDALRAQADLLDRLGHAEQARQARQEADRRDLSED